MCDVPRVEALLACELREELLQCMPQLGDRAVSFVWVFHETALNDLVDALRQLGVAWRTPTGRSKGACAGNADGPGHPSSGP